MNTAADIMLSWDGEKLCADISRDGADLRRGDDLATSVIASLFSWRRAKDDDALPDYETGLQGWWGDTFLPNAGDKFGSRLWILRRKKLTNETINLAVECCQEALAWMLEDGVASRISITPSRGGIDQLDIFITIFQTDGTAAELNFQGVWQAIQKGGR